MPVVSDFTALLREKFQNGLSTQATPTVVTYSFDTAPISYFSTSQGYTTAVRQSFETFDTAERLLAQQALDAWSNISGIEFVLVGAGQGDMRFGSYDFSLNPAIPAGLSGVGYFADREIQNTFAEETLASGDVFLDVDAPNSLFAMLQLTGAALGFDDPSQGENTLAPALDNTSNTVMSSNGSPVSTLQAFDIQAAQSVYGTNDDANSPLLSHSLNAAATELTQTWDDQDSTIAGSAIDDIIYGGAGDDRIAGFFGDDMIFGQAGNDRLIAGQGTDILDGGAGEDILYADGSGTRHLLRGGLGNDTLIGGNSASADYSDDVVGTITFDRDAGGSFGVHTVTATDGSVDTLHNLARIIGSTGADVMNNVLVGRGGDGDDTLSGQGSAFRTFVSGGHYQLFGENGNDTLTAGNLAGTLDGGAGNDTINAFGAVHFVWGGDGDDVIKTDSANLNITELVGEGIDTVESVGSFVLDANVENLIITGAAAADGIGNASDNVFTGNAARNVFIGDAGNDTFIGNGGNDQLIGETGDDTYVVGAAGATLVETAGEGTDTVNSAISFILAANFENLTLTGTADIDGLGNGASNTIIGNDGANGLAGGNANDLLIGGAGNDSLDGQNGIDTMRGGTGNDGYNVDRIEDVVEEDFNGGELDILRTAVTYTLPDNVEIGILKGGAGSVIDITGNDGSTDDVRNLILGNDAANRIQTFGGNDVILGRGGDDTIIGGGGRDNIVGGAGADILTGGAGNDFFNFTSIADGGDLITDFAIADTDVLDLRAMFDTFVGGAILNTTTAQAQGYLTLTDNGSSISVFADADGGADNNQLIALLNNVTDDVTAVDNFILV